MLMSQESDEVDAGRGVDDVPEGDQVGVGSRETGTSGGKSFVFFYNGPTPASFCSFLFFQNTIFRKNFRLQLDSN